MINQLSTGGTTVLVTTHYLEEAEYCNNIILINAGKLIAEGNAKQLKTEYLKNPIFEIECTNVVDAMELFEETDFVDETSIFGNYIHIIVNDKFENEDQIKNVLNTNSNIEIKRIEKIIPTLEDVFIYLLEKGKENNGS